MARGEPHWWDFSKKVKGAEGSLPQEERGGGGGYRELGESWVCSLTPQGLRELTSASSSTVTYLHHGYLCIICPLGSTQWPPHCRSPQALATTLLGEGFSSCYIERISPFLLNKAFECFLNVASYKVWPVNCPLLAVWGGHPPRDV